MTLKSALTNVMISAARKTARSLVRDFGEVENLQVSKKGPSNFVSAADLRAEHILRTELERVRPGYGFLLEEAGAVEGSDRTHRWLVDPLDGTTNFLHGLPHFAISIALERERQLVAGVIYDPIKDEMFRAEKGKGAYLNDRRIRVTARRALGDALLATGRLSQEYPGHELMIREFTAITNKVAGVRRYGSAALDLAYVAAGRYDAFWERGLNPWDIAAGIVLVREAGGIVKETDGRDVRLDSPSILASNEFLFGQVSKILTSVEPARHPG